MFTLLFKLAERDAISLHISEKRIVDEEPIVEDSSGSSLLVPAENDTQIEEENQNVNGIVFVVFISQMYLREDVG